MAERRRERVAVVTGSNKGIGLQIVRRLCRELGDGGVVYLTARNEGRGREAVTQLKKEGLTPLFYPLDVTNQSHIDAFRDHLRITYDGVDVLINNAGIGSASVGHLPERERAAEIQEANFFGVLNVCSALLPLVRSGGRVVNMASTTSYLTFRELDDALKQRFRDATEESDVITLIEDYLRSTKAGSLAETGWIDWPYGISKLGVVALSAIQARRIGEDKTRHDVRLNSCCPGFVLTDMTKHLPADYFGGDRVTVDEGVDTPLYLAFLPPEVKEPHGQFVLRRQAYDFMHSDVTIALVENFKGGFNKQSR